MCRLTCTDDRAASTHDDCTVTVNAEPNATPVANAGGNVQYNAAHQAWLVTLDASSTSDTDTNDVLTYSWDCGNNVIGVGPIVSVTLPACSGTSCQHTCQLTVTDSYGASSTNDSVITLVE